MGVGGDGHTKTLKTTQKLFKYKYYWISFHKHTKFRTIKFLTGYSVLHKHFVSKFFITRYILSCIFT